MAVNPREETKQGIESQMGVCHVAHFCLTLLLREPLKDGRVVCVSSIAHRLGTKEFLDSDKLESSV